MLSSGSSEILRAAVNSQVRSHGRLVAASPTSEWFETHCQRSNAEIVTVPLTHVYEHDWTRCSPASVQVLPWCTSAMPPLRDGYPTRPDALEAFVRKLPAATHVLIDEAYHHYVTPSVSYASWLDRSLADARVIVTRSFSKIHGLAGLRIGYTVTTPRLRVGFDSLSSMKA